MVKIKTAVSDAGPFLHLEEVEQLGLLDVVKAVLTTPEIMDERGKITESLKRLKGVRQKELTPKNKDITKYLMRRYGLHLGETTGIALCKQEQIKLFFTDDLEARQIAQVLKLKPHGTLAIVLRALKERLLTKEQATKAVHDIYEKSSMFFTKDLESWTINEIEMYKKGSKPDIT